MVEVPASMSPVSPTFTTPSASSLIRFASPSNDTIGKSAAGVFVANTTNSWVSVPSFVTRKETGPSFANGCERWMYIVLGSVSPRATVTGAAVPGVAQKSWCIPIA